MFIFHQHENDIQLNLILWNHNFKNDYTVFSNFYLNMSSGVSKGYMRLVFEGCGSTPGSVEELEEGLWDADRLFGFSSAGGGLQEREVFGGQHQSHESELCVYCRG